MIPDTYEEFLAFAKIGRLSRDCVITEKIDGTNAQIVINDDLSVIRAGSRTRYITAEKGKDNFNFAAWVEEHSEELRALGPGRHYGEWWGQGIQRGYGLTEKRFSLFNSDRWSDARGERPACCHVVPTLYVGPFSTIAIDGVLDILRHSGSVAAPGFLKPEGIVIFHMGTGTFFKKTLERDEEPKGSSKEHSQ